MRLCYLKSKVVCDDVDQLHSQPLDDVVCERTHTTIFFTVQILHIIATIQLKYIIRNIIFNFVCQIQKGSIY